MNIQALRIAVKYHMCNMLRKQPSSDMAAFRDLFAKARRVVVLTGAGVSAESGVPTFRGAGGLWRQFNATDLATFQAFSKNPSLVWEFYHYRRELVRTKQPNAAHFAIADCEKRLAKQGRHLALITQNADNLHRLSGSQHVIELHGNLFKTRCTKCGDISDNFDSPICEALRDRGAPDAAASSSPIPVKDLPRCQRCEGLLRPHVVWFGESLDPDILEATEHQLEACDLCLVIGTSSVVYPAAGFAPALAARGVPVAEFNAEATDATYQLGFHFNGPAGHWIPQALAKHESEPS